MPMFYTPKPHKFTYRPRFYDPEKEQWEALKQKYADEHATAQESATEQSPATGEQMDSEVAYFQQRVRQIDREERRKQSRFTFKDLVRKREMPTFHYQPRFATDAEGMNPSAVDAEGQAILRRMQKHKISRRFDMGDSDYMKPVSGGKIVMYVLTATLLLLWILL